jgi:hypothetical protein
MRKFLIGAWKMPRSGQSCLLRVWRVPCKNHGGCDEGHDEGCVK